jgi:imidazolonepropionase-like amidohydrolase
MPDRIVLRAPRLWDGTGRAVVPEAAVVLEGDRIAAAGPAHDAAGPAGFGVTELRFPSGSILPGLIDTHVHLIWPGDGTPAHEYTQASSAERLLLTAVRNAHAALRAGVTTVRDLGSLGRIVLELRDAVNAGLILGPRILASGPPITITGGHMHYLGGEADTKDDVRRVARRNWRMGADLLKMVLNGGGTPRTHSWIPAYAEEEIQAAAAEARDHETQLIVHANSPEAIRRGVRAGADSVEHCTFLQGPGAVEFDREVAEEIVRRGVYVGHTLQAGYRSLERARAQWDGLSPEDRTQWDARRRVLDAQMRSSKTLLDMGAALVGCTDAGWSLNPFGDYWLGMDLLVQAGASPSQALACGTAVAARALRLDDRLGTVEPGKIADLTIVDGDPTQRIADLRRVCAVFRSGRLVVRDGVLCS